VVVEVFVSESLCEETISLAIQRLLEMHYVWAVIGLEV
jgi:hypothetical protein